ncbi:hypothetical protein EJ05DRAFT_489833 [Pseudovirgaria hyperparasitica]|uniref:Asl1-like glycosyl hydrolase catalytic domain-containing protein n=1 Tax=Pseudovirgaria hyperparasitica TaxID=470096 RepID=A0A6A6VU18_9PEZI|nr:uncharacterized protein EJ05DRAFT_489833 [Pseudovirgaria hyperparasitica]KAF2753645.1 hypothetical protein EJ05DRAFT_489833 [Pseudovirgaria hyperparasitica]
MSTKLALLALLSSALAVPFDARHPKYPAGNTTAVMPTGGYGGDHSTVEPTTYITSTSYITQFITLTRPHSPSAPEQTPTPTQEQSVDAEATGGAGSDSGANPGGYASQGSQQCGAVVTSTVKQQVTVTVTAGSANTPAPAPPAAPSAPAEPSVAQSPVAAPSFATYAPESSAAPPESHAPEATPSPTPAPAPAPAPAPVSSVVQQPAPSSSTEEGYKPAPTAGSSPKGGKRGLAYNDASLTTCFKDNAKVSWAYNWEATPRNLDSAFEYVPTMWGMKSDFTSTWKGFADAAIASGSKHLMAFNEPDLTSQANMSPADAAKNYRTYFQQYYGKGLRLGAPSVTNGGGNMGLTWLASFMKECSDCQIDFCPVHWYDSYQNIDYFKSHMQKATEACNGKPIWLTEFGTNDGSDDQISGFLKTVLPWLDSQDYVERYAYFMAGTGARQLVTGTAASTIGAVYGSA